MEIKCVKKEKVEYPKINEISRTKIKLKNAVISPDTVLSHCIRCLHFHL